MFSNSTAIFDLSFQHFVTGKNGIDCFTLINYSNVMFGQPNCLKPHYKFLKSFIIKCVLKG